MTDFSHLKPGDAIFWRDRTSNDCAGVVGVIGSKGRTMRVGEYNVFTGRIYGSSLLKAGVHEPVKVNITIEELCQKLRDLNARRKHALQQIREQHAGRVAKMLEESQ